MGKSPYFMVKSIFFMGKSQLFMVKFKLFMVKSNFFTVKSQFFTGNQPFFGGFPRTARSTFVPSFPKPSRRRISISAPTAGQLARASWAWEYHENILPLIYNSHRIHGAAMVTWIPSIYPSHVSIYTSTMDPSWDWVNGSIPLADVWCLDLTWSKNLLDFRQL